MPRKITCIFKELQIFSCPFKAKHTFRTRFNSTWVWLPKQCLSRPASTALPHVTRHLPSLSLLTPLPVTSHSPTCHFSPPPCHPVTPHPIPITPHPIYYQPLLEYSVASYNLTDLNSLDVKDVALFFR